MFVIAGVTGHVGSVVASTLLAQGEKVRVIVRDAGKGEAWAAKGAEVALASLDDAAALTQALRGAEGAFVLVPPNFAAPDFVAYAKRVSAALGKAAKDAGVRHVALLSSVGADLDHSNGPIKGLFYAEHALREAGVVLSAIRAGFFQENVGMAIEPAKAMGMYFNFGESHDYPIPMIATQDIGKLAAERLRARPQASEVIDLHGPAYSHGQLAEKLGQALGKTLQVVDIPQPGWVDALMQGGVPKHFAELYAEMYGGFASGAIVPRGDRLVQGTTAIDGLIAAMAK